MSDTEQKENKEQSAEPVAVKPESQNNDDAQADTISIKVTDNQTEVTFKVKRKTPLHKVMDAFCKRTSKDANSLRFTFDGERVARDDTPGSLGMEDDDKIEALNQQTGGFM